MALSKPHRREGRFSRLHLVIPGYEGGGIDIPVTFGYNWLLPVIKSRGSITDNLAGTCFMVIA